MFFVKHFQQVSNTCLKLALDYQTLSQDTCLLDFAIQRIFTCIVNSYLPDNTKYIVYP